MTHLAHCRECYEAYAESVEAVGRWNPAGERAGADPEWIQAGRQVASPGGTGSVEGERQGPASNPSRGARGRLARPALAWASILVLGVAAWWIWGPSRSGPRTSLDSADLALLRTAMARASDQGLVYPGVGGLPLPEATLYRDGNGHLQQDLDRMIRSLKLKTSDGGSLPEDLLWLSAAYLLEGNLAQADHYLRKARLEQPEDAGILMLSAILAFRESRTQEAEALLGAVLALDPDLPEARFNRYWMRRSLEPGPSPTGAGALPQALPGTVLAARLERLPDPTPAGP